MVVCLGLRAEGCGSRQWADLIEPEVHQAGRHEKEDELPVHKDNTCISRGEREGFRSGEAHSPFVWASYLRRSRGS